MHYSKLNLKLDVDPAIGKFIRSLLHTADNDKSIKPFDFDQINTYYLEEYDVSVLKYMNPNGTSYYGVFGNGLFKYFLNWTDMRDLLVSKGVTWQLGDPPEWPEMVCNNYGSVAHVDQLRTTGINFIAHEDEKVPFNFYDNNTKEIVEECYHDNQWFVFNAKKLHGTDVFDKENIRAIVSLCIMDSYEEMLQKLEEYII